MTMSDLMMNVHTYITETTAYNRVYMISLCQILWWMYTHVLLITLLTPCCVSDHYAWFNDECKHIFTNNTTFTMLYVRSLYQILHTRATVNTTYTMVYERSLSDLMTNVHTCVVGCQITMSDLTMNVHTCLSDNTT